MCVCVCVCVSRGAAVISSVYLYLRIKEERLNEGLSLGAIQMVFMKVVRLCKSTSKEKAIIVQEKQMCAHKVRVQMRKPNLFFH